MPRRHLELESEDEWVERGWHRGYGAPPPPPRQELLVPGGAYSARHTRSRSTGAPIAPNIQIHNTTRQDLDSSPPRGRGHYSRYHDEELVDAVEDVAREIRRGRSRGPPEVNVLPYPAQGVAQPSFGFRDPSPYYQNMQLELAREREKSKYDLERERERLEAELQRDRLEARERSDHEAQLIRTRAEIKRLKEKLEEDAKDSRKEEEQAKWKRELELERLRESNKRTADEIKRKEERDRILAEREREEREEKRRKELAKKEWEEKEKEEEEERARVVNEFRLKEEKKKKKDAEAETAAIAAYQKKQAEEKKKKDDLIAQYKAEEEAAAKKAKEEKEMWRLKLQREADEEKAKKKAREEEIDEEMRKKLAKFGLQNNQVEAILDPKKADKLKPGQSPQNPIRPHHHHHGHSSSALVISKPTYIRIHRSHLDVETLRYYGLPWEYDTTDTNYIVILQEIDHSETEILFEHTRKLRKGASTLLIEERGKKDPQYAFVRRRASRSRSRRRSSPKRVSVNFGLFG